MKRVKAASAAYIKFGRSDLQICRYAMLLTLISEETLVNNAHFISI